MKIRDLIEHRIQLKEQLISLVRREIEALERELKGLEEDPRKLADYEKNLRLERMGASLGRELAFIAKKGRSHDRA